VKFEKQDVSVRDGCAVVSYVTNYSTEVRYLYTRHLENENIFVFT
jgi:hypothetical protein